MKGIPVVISTNGYGVPIREVEKNAPLLEISENGYGMPIVLSDLGTPAVIKGGGGGPTYDADATALFARMSVQPDATRKGLINTLISSAKANGWWGEIDVLCLPGADSQASLLNWKSSSFNATLVSSPAFTANQGFVTDGSASYIDTNFNPVTAGGQFLQNDAVFGVWHGGNVSRVNSTAGWFDGSDGVTVNPRTAGGATFGFRINQASAVTLSNSDGSGLAVVERTSATAIRAYRNGASLGTTSASSAALNSASFNIGRVTASSFQAVEWRGHVIGGALGPSLNTAMYNDILAYLQAIGAV